MICAVTMNDAEEAEGIIRAARSAQMPVAVLFTVETDGRLPTGQLLRSAIEGMGNPAELDRDYARLTRRLPRLNVMGGCCGTDHRHVERIADACVPLVRDVT
jgi:homocysteine S-methyltransferase